MVAAEGIDKSGKGVLRMSFMPLSESGTIRLDSQMDAASSSLRIPVDALEIRGFGRSNNDMVGLLPKFEDLRIRTDNLNTLTGKVNGQRQGPKVRHPNLGRSRRDLRAPGGLQGSGRKLIVSFVQKCCPMVLSLLHVRA